jgi:hypothetical protein
MKGPFAPSSDVTGGRCAAIPQLAYRVGIVTCVAAVGIEWIVTELDETREFFRQCLGDDWELTLIAADAFPSSEASVGDLIAAQHRAVELICDVCNDWRIETQDSVARAWKIAWLHSGR